MQQKKIDVWAGLFVLFGLAATVLLALSVGAKGWGGRGDTYTVTAKFAGVGALKKDAAVKMVGVEIGRVGDLQLVDDEGEYKTRVTMHIRKDVKLPENASAMVFTTGLLGAQFVNIDQVGSLKSTPLLTDGGEIKDTEKAMQLEELIKNFGVSQAEKAAGTPSEGKP